MPTKEPQPLSEEALAEIEAKRTRNEATNGDIDALVHTVRALRAILHDPQKWMRWCDHRVLEENESLREQLAHRTIELENESREMQKWNNRANQLAIEGQELRQRLAQVEKELVTTKLHRDDLIEELTTRLAIK